LVASSGMKKKFNNTVIASFALILLTAGYVLYTRHKGSEPVKSETKPEEKLLTLASSHIRSVTLSPREGEAVTCARAGGSWNITAPKSLPADSTAITALLDSLTSASISEVIDQTPKNLKDYGLDPPAEMIKVSTDAKPAEFELKLGDETPTSTGLYAQAGTSPRVVTLAAYLKTSLEKSLFDLRDKRAVTFESGQITKIEAESKGHHLTLEKNPEGVWDLVLPPPVRADKYAVENLVDRLHGLQMQSVVADEKKEAVKYGLNSPTLRIQLSGPKGSETLLVGKKDGDRYDAANSALDPVFTLNSDIVTDFEKDPSDLRDKDLFSYSAFDVKQIIVTTASGRRVFDKNKTKWSQSSPKSKDEPSDKVETLLDRLRELRATSFPKPGPPASFGLAKPAYQFEVHFGAANEAESVEIGAAGDKVFARRTNDSLPCELPKSALDDIEKALKDLPQ
jgi:uncharacterized protein DUF4340